MEPEIVFTHQDGFILLNTNQLSMSMKEITFISPLLLTLDPMLFNQVVAVSTPFQE